MGIYIISSCAISPQQTFNKGAYLHKIIDDNFEYKKCIEPDYKAYIEPKLLRRMSRIIKMGVTSALECLRTAHIDEPNAIVIGTGLGCLEDTEKFLESLVLGDGILSPTPFIQSTHNTIAGQISLLLNSNAYSMTFAQRGHSFENALQEAILLVEQGKNNVLVGAVDEVTPTSYKILQDLNYNQNSTKTGSSGKTSIGEGACFFLLSSKAENRPLVELVAVETFLDPGNIHLIEEKITEILTDKGIGISELDGILLGRSGSDDTYYDHLINTIFEGRSIYNFKHLCGDYFTASSFGMELAVNMIQNQCEYGKVERHQKFSYVLIYNHVSSKYHSLIILKKCQDLHSS